MRRTVAVLAAATLLAACQATTRSIGPPAATTTRSPVAAALPTTVPTTVPTILPSASAPVSTPPSARSLVDARLATIARRLPAGAVSVGVLNVRTGASYRWGETQGMWTGSVYKLLVLESLLLQRQRTGGWLSYDEISASTDMIEKSDNKAGYRMYLDVGGGPALAAAAKRLGLRHTHIGISDPALTTTSAADGLILLRHLVDGGPLNTHSKGLILGLMRTVQADQRWGAGAVADRGTTFANKNGWMQVGPTNGPGEDDGGRWLVNSLGVVRVGGQPLLISIFTRHNPDCYTGIHLVEKLARVIVPAVVPAAI